MTRSFQHGRPAGWVAHLDERYGRFLDRRLPAGGLTFGNRVRLLDNGAAAFGAMLRAIEGARREVRLCIYMFMPDEAGWRFARALADAARRGCRVHVAYDWVGSWGEGRAHFRFLRHAGASVHAINPWLPKRLSQVWHPNTRDHRKMLTVDGRRAYIGGLNIAQEYDGHAQDTHHWRDFAVEITGPGARYLRRLQRYTCLTGLGLPPARPPSGTGGRDVAVWLHSPEPFDYKRTLLKAYIALIAGAQRYVWLTNAYFLPSWPLLRALTAAAGRGVDVRLLLPAVSDVPIVRTASRRWYEFLLAHGVRIWERQGTILHAKAAVADDEVSLLGSANLDVRSLYIDREVMATIFDAAFARELAGHFRDDFRHSRGQDLERLRRRPLRQKLKERLAHMVSPLL